MGAQIVDNMRAVDVLYSLDYVESANIGATGGSGGGNQTMWLTAMDDRVTAAVPVVSVGTFQSYVMRTNCICECLPNGLTFTEESGVLALVAPRALKICNCLGDSNPTFYPAEMLRSYQEARKVFQAYGKDAKLAYQVYNKPHCYDSEIREAMLGWFDLHLKGIGTGAPRKEIPFDALPEEKMMVFDKGQRPEEVISIAEYCRWQGEELKAEIEVASIDKESKKAELRDILGISALLDLKTTHEYGLESDWEKIALETVCGRMIPVLRRKPQDGSSDYVIASSINGKSGLEENKYLNDAWDSGKGIILFDVYGSGEDCWG